MTYRMKIESEDPIEIINNETNELVVIEVGCKYIYSMSKPKTKKDKEHNGDIVEVLGFSNKFMGDAIVRYMDTQRRGSLNVSYLLPYTK